MLLLSVQNITKHFGPEPVLAGVSFEVRAGEKVSLVGPNGTGKTTLLKIIVGDEEADSGSIDRPTSANLGFLEQHPDFEPGKTVWDEAELALADVKKLSSEAEEIAAAMAEASDDAEHRRLADRYEYLQHELQHRDGYNLNHKIERVLAGLGFAMDSLRQPIEQLSGGQQNRLLLAKLLLEEPDLLLLDEPSNHLDIDATEWLEEFLSESKQALIVVSHDRYFLDKVTTRTLELFHGTVDSYCGNYTAYCRQKAERLEVQRRTFEKQQIEIARMEDFIRRHHYGQKHLQAEDRRKKLERIERLDPPRDIEAPRMQFPAASRTGDIVLRVEHLSKSFDQPLFQDLTFDILRGDKWGMLGPNGCGKTTLLRCLIGKLKPDAGTVSVGTGVKIAYFDQLLARLDPEAVAVEAIRPDHKEFVEQERRDLLARFGVTGDMVFQKVKQLSGGERNRTALAMLAATDANVLVLDEPTNHLDLWARESLENAIKQFDGTVLFVTHDRYFLDQVADHLLVVQPDRFRVVEGNYATYRHLVKVGLAAEARGDSRGKDDNHKPHKQRKQSPSKPPRRKRQFPYRKVEELETEIAELESRIQQLHEDLARPEVLRDGERVKRTQTELEDLQRKLTAVYEHWEEACELN